MFETWQLLWGYLAAQPAVNYWRLQPWHLNMVLAGLGLLAAGGLHHVLGYTFRLYHLNAVHRSWLGLPSLFVLVPAVLLLLGTYVVGTQSQALVRAGMAPAEGESPVLQLGAILLDPSLRGPLGKAQTIAHAELLRTVSELTEAQYMERLESFRRSPAALVPPSSAGQESPARSTPLAGQTSGAAMAQLGLRWLLEESRTLPAESPGAPAMDTHLPALTMALLSPGASAPLPAAPLSRAGWEQVAGEQFASRVLVPLLSRGVARLMAGLAALILLVTGGYFLVLVRLRRSVHRVRTAAQSEDAAPAPGGRSS